MTENRDLLWQDRAKRSVKSVRDWSPLNTLLTTTVRTGLRRLGQAPPDNLVRYLPRVGVVEATLPNGARLRMWSKGDDDVATAVFWRGWAGFEPETSPTFYELAGSSRLTVDVGAHVGYFSVLAALANAKGEVHAFEPLPPVHSRLERNVALNGLSNVKIHQLALGREGARADFFHVPHSIPSSSSLSRAFMESIVEPDRLVASPVEVSTFDAFAEEHGLTGIDLVKIDTESTEHEVLAGMTETLERDRPAIVCEILPGGPGEAVEDILRPFGYRYLLLTGTGPVPREHVEPHSKWRNFLFQPSA